LTAVNIGMRDARSMELRVPATLCGFRRAMPTSDTLWRCRITKRMEAKPPRRRAAPTRPTAVETAHPKSVPTVEPAGELERVPDQPFAEGAGDTIDRDLRYRMISETAYRYYVERGYADGYDVDDWLQAEAEVDHLLLDSAQR
jgi:hypothetical protein